MARQALADDELPIVVEGRKPAIAAQRSHLVDVVDVDQRVAMYSAKARANQFLLGFPEALRCQVSLLRCDDPDQLTIGLKSQNFVAFSKKYSSPDFPTILRIFKATGTLGGHQKSGQRETDFPSPDDRLNTPAAGVRPVHSKSSGRNDPRTAQTSANKSPYSVSFISQAGFV